MTRAGTITGTQNHALQYVARYETAEYGVIIRHMTGTAMIERGYMTSATRRPFSRETGVCVRLTDKGKVWLHERS